VVAALCDEVANATVDISRVEHVKAKRIVEAIMEGVG
jgi:hypothetical protein